MRQSIAVMASLWLGISPLHAYAQRGTVRIGAPSVDVQALLGSGYSSQKERFDEGCIGGEAKFSGAQTSEISFSQVTSQADLASSLGFQVDTRVRFGLVSVGAGAKFHTASQSTNYSLAAVYGATYKFKNEILTKPVLTEVGKSVREHDERWLETCGDEYVWQREIGAKFFFSIRIDFASEVDKQYFEANFSLQSPPLDIAAGLQTAKDRLSKRTTVTIGALQIGGSVERLTEMFGASDERLAFVQCSTGEFGHCFKVLKAALDYATDVKNGFPSQISATLGTEAPGGPAILAYHTRSYKGAGFYPRGYPLLDEAVKQSRRDLLLAFEELYQDKVKLQQILYSKSLRQSPRQKASLLETEKIVEFNKNKILEASQVCYETPLECPARVARLIGSDGELKPVDRTVFLIRPESFAQYCDLTRLPEPDPALKLTVDAVIQEARRIDAPAFKASEEAVDECSLAEDVIRRARRLGLAKKGLRDLRPLAHFTHLEALDLRENQITDLTPIEGMVQLVELDLSRNRIRSADALARLTLLEKLVLRDNQIANALPLASLKKMERLDLRNNDPGITCPYPEPERCLIGDFKETNSFIAIQLGRTPRTQHTATTLADGRILIAGGWAPQGPLAEIYDDHRRFVPTRGAMQSARGAHTATLLGDGKVLLAGGWGVAGSIETYDPTTDSFTLIGQNMRASRASHSATLLLDGTVLIAGGWSGKRWTGAERDASASAEIFFPRTGTLTPVRSMKFRRAEHSATLLADGTVLIAGGFTQGGGLATAEIYDPATRQFRHSKGRMKAGRGAHTATRLPGGNVLLVGGWWDENGDARHSAEIYDAGTGVFRTIKGEAMDQGRAWHTASLLHDGRVLVAGGMSAWDMDLKACTSCLDSAAIFDPGSETFTSIPRPMGARRVFHSATPLDDMMVLILGGGSGEASQSGDIYEYRR